MPITPPARPLSELQTDICRFVGMPDDTDVRAAALAAIRDAIRRLNGKPPLRQLTFPQTITFVADQAEYDLVESVRAPLLLELLDGSGNARGGRLGHLAFEEFARCYPDRSVSGSPQTYTIFSMLNSQKLTLSAPPSAQWVADNPSGKLWYRARVAFPSDPASAMNVTSECEGWIEWAAKQAMAADFSPEKYRAAEGHAAERWEELMLSDNAMDWMDWPD